ncbi:MAG: hypothetical protein J5X21_09685 [Candidatus Accumulibacter sp.]|nr:hypothetical protein [Candidatus Accumulibacter conexus]
MTAQYERRLQHLGWAELAAETPIPAIPSAPDARQAAADSLATRGGGASRPASQSIMDIDSLVERFVPIDDGTGNYVFDMWKRSVVKRSQMVALMPAGLLFDDLKRHDRWISRGACHMDQVGFDPAGTDEQIKLNTWRGWPLKPSPGRCERLLDLVEYLCSGDEHGERVARWLLQWMAYPLQHPGGKMASAVIMHGPQGTGKSTLFQAYSKIYGDYASVLNQRGLEDRFNADWIEGKLFLLAEEVVPRANMWHLKGELKELVTGEWVRINSKALSKNNLNICDDWPMVSAWSRS